MPIDHFSEFDFAEAQQLHFMPANPLGVFDSLFDPLRKGAANKIQASLTLTANCREIEVLRGFLHQVTFEVIENLIGWRNADLVHAFEAVQSIGAGDSRRLATSLGWTIERAADALQSLALRGLVLAASGTFRPLPIL